MPNLTPAQRVAAETARIAGNVVDAYTACSAKGATMPAAADQDSDHLAATINTITGGSPAPTPTTGKKDVNFYDYDGTLLYSYTNAEASGMDRMPALPVHRNIDALEWNYSLADVREAAAAGRGANVGVMYDTADGATKLYLKAEAHATLPSLDLHLQLTAQAAVTVDWGDGTTTVLTNTSTSAKKVSVSLSYREFTQATTVCISISGDDFALGWDSDSNNIFNNTKQPLVKLNIGSNCIAINQNAFCNCYSLTSVTIPDSVTSIGSFAFNYCYSLTSVTIPDSVTSISSYAFNYCYSLTSVTIPSGVTSIGSYAFNVCYSLTSVTIPDSVTSIGSYAFQNCYSLTSVTIPSGVTSIDNYAFNDATNIQIVDLSEYTDPAHIPTVATSSFSGTTCKFLVASATMLAAFQVATNWSSISSDRWEALS